MATISNSGTRIEEEGGEVAPFDADKEREIVQETVNKILPLLSGLNYSTIVEVIKEAKRQAKLYPIPINRP